MRRLLSLQVGQFLFVALLAAAQSRVGTGNHRATVAARTRAAHIRAGDARAGFERKVSIETGFVLLGERHCRS